MPPITTFRRIDVSPERRSANGAHRDDMPYTAHGVEILVRYTIVVMVGLNNARGGRNNNNDAATGAGCKWCLRLTAP